MDYKICCGCNINKPLTEYHNCISKKDGKKSQCKECSNAAKRVYNKEHRDVSKAYYERNKTRIINYQQRYSQENKEKRNEYRVNKYNTDEQYRLRELNRDKLYKFFKGKRNTVADIIQLDYQSYIKWIEFQFDSDMTLDNYGTYWEIDHTIPLSSFNLLDEAELREAMHWTNLRPLKKEHNKSKFTKVDNWLKVCQEIKSKYFIKNFIY